MLLACTHAIAMLENSIPSSPSPLIRRWLRGSLLGAGSFGSVSLARNLDDGFLFAVKSTPCSPSLQLLSLQNELHILHSLNSPRIISCLGANISLCGNSPCLNLFLEYMQEGSIADLLKTSGGRLDEKRARVYTRAILEGLCYLHKQGIVHSDIKGQNILLGACGEVKIADFGAAKRVESTAENWQICKMRGTPLWMAPEVLQGVEQGTPSDIWSLGCTLVEMLQGRPPWGSLKEHTSTNDLASLLFKIAYTDERPPFVDSLLSMEAKDFLNKCLQRDPMDRWTAEQLLGHPFVMIKEQGLCDYPLSQASPRSTLDFYEESDADWESESPRGFHLACMSCANATEDQCDGQQRKVVFIENMVEFGPMWVTVRRADDWSEERQKPFFRAGEVNVRKGSEVSLDALSFLANRVKAVVG